MRQFTRWWSPIWSLWWQTSECFLFVFRMAQWPDDKNPSSLLRCSGQKKAVMFNRVILRWTVPLLNDNWFKQQHSEPRIVKVRFKSAEVFQRFGLTLLNYVTTKKTQRLRFHSCHFTDTISQTSQRRGRDYSTGLTVEAEGHKDPKKKKKKSTQLVQADHFLYWSELSPVKYRTTFNQGTSKMTN